MRGDRLKERREEKGLSQADLGARVGVDGNSIYRYEKTPMGLSADVLEKLADALDVSADWLLGLVDGKNDHLEDEGLTPTERRLLDSARNANFIEMMKAAIKLYEEQNKPGIAGAQPATNS